MELGLRCCLLVTYSLVLLFAASALAEAQAVPSPEQVALSELHELQLRAPELWKRRDEQCMGCGAAAVSVGVPVASIFLPIGGIVYAFSDYSDYYYDGQWDAGYSYADVKHDRRLGGALMAIGGLGVAAIVWGAYKIATARRTRRAVDQELRSLGARRSVLEQMIGSFVIGQAAPISSVNEP